MHLGLKDSSSRAKLLKKEQLSLFWSETILAFLKEQDVYAHVHIHYVYLPYTTFKIQTLLGGFGPQLSWVCFPPMRVTFHEMSTFSPSAHK